MTSEPNNTTQNDIDEQELEKLDANLLEVELLYKSRCVQAPTGRNVTVREIEKEEE